MLNPAGSHPFSLEPRAWLAAIIENSDDAIVSNSLDGVITSWNGAAERMFGFSADQAIGKPIGIIIPDDRMFEEREILAKISQGMRVEHFETKRRRNDGSSLWVSVTISPIRDQSGVICGASNIPRNLTDRKPAAELEQLLGEMNRRSAAGSEVSAESPASTESPGSGVLSHDLAVSNPSSLEPGAWLEAIIAHSDDAIISQTLAGVITSWNGAAERMFGFSAEQAIGQNIGIIIPDDRMFEEREVRAKIRHGTRVEHFETKRRKQDGGSLWVSVAVSPIRDANRVICGASKILRDLTDRKQSGELEKLLCEMTQRIMGMPGAGAESAAFEVFNQRKSDMEVRVRSERISNQLELLIDYATDYSICMLDAEGFVMTWNMGAERIFGWTAGEALGRHISIFFPVDKIVDGTPNLQIAVALEHGKLQDRGVRIRKDGSEFLADVTMTSIRDILGNEIGFGKLVRDITNEQAQADEIEAREMHLQSILSTVPDAMVVIDEEGTVVSFSAAAETLFKYTQEEAMGQNIAMLMGPADKKVPHDYLTRYRVTGERRILGAGRRVIGSRSDGSPLPLELSIGEAIGAGKPVFTAFLHDLTERDKAEAQMQEFQMELLHLTRVGAMGAMAATLAHELNQPLTAVTNYVQTSRSLLEAPDASTLASVQEALAIAGDEALRAGEIVRRLREFVARGETAKTIELVPQLITDSCLLGLAGAAACGIASRIDTALNLVPVFIDRVQIQQVLINLIRNAVQAMCVRGSGEVEIASQADGAFVRISVTDNGPGLAKEVKERLFEAFVSSKPDGMGLGLSICRSIVEAHGGSIWYQDAPQGGASFHFTVPVAEIEDDEG